MLQQVFPPPMTARQARNARRAAERQAAKQSKNTESIAPLESAPAEAVRPNRSGGPSTPEGKATSRWNSFKHGLYAKQLVLPGEDPAQLDALRSRLCAEHQPVNETEEILVNEIAENFWRLRRFRELEARGMQPENMLDWLDRGLLPLIARQMASAERALHKAITALRRLQLDRGFVPSKSEQASAAGAGFVPSKCEQAANTPAGFVHANSPQPEFVPQNGAQPGFVPSISQQDSRQHVLLRVR